MPKCPILIHALVTQEYDSAPLHKATEKKSEYLGIDCMKTGCQMWNSKEKDCGLKSPSDISVKLAVKDEPKPKEIESIPEERDSTPAPFPKKSIDRETKKLEQDPWTCPE